MPTEPPRAPLLVLLTVDTEVWTPPGQPPGEAFERCSDRDVYGRTNAGDYGVRYQMDILRRHGLRAVFHVEALHALEVGPAPLQRLVGEIQDGGHEVQLHLHTEWLSRMRQPRLGSRRGQNLREFTPDEQATLLGEGLSQLQTAGARNVNAFRAGNYGASDETLRVLAGLGIRYDTSHNVPYLAGACAVSRTQPLCHPRRLEGLVEIPVSHFVDGFGRPRSAQLNGCSFREMQAALNRAFRAGYATFVIVFHSFELLNARKSAPDPIVLRRLERLCRFLRDEPDRFRVVTFGDLDGLAIPLDLAIPPLRVPPIPSSIRIGEQLVRRLRN